MSGRSLPRAWAVASLVLCVSMVIGQAPVSGQQRRTDGLPPVARNVMYVNQPTGRRAVEGHVAQEDIESHRWTIRQLRLAGERLFLAQFTRHDGAGRSGATGDPSPTRRPIGSGRDFLRTAGPDANSCFSCHSMPSVGGAGAFTANVFAGLGSVHPLAFSVDPGLSSERGTPELHGSSAIELLAREMTQDLHGLREGAIEEARRLGSPRRVKLVAKGVSFGYVTADPDGTLHLGEVEGVDRDLVVRPWGQKGTVTSLRTFTVNAMNLHHGMQARERFGLHLTGTDDFDRDGVGDELTEGDITALVVFQATLSVPGQVLPRDRLRREAVARGEARFRASLCAQCHVPALPLRNPIFTEPGPYNLEGTLRTREVSRVLPVDLRRDTEVPRLAPDSNGVVWVRAFTDLKRHRISDEEKPHFGNEILVEGLVPVDAFLTRRLWAVGNTGPYGHRGDLTTIEEAIAYHGGEAREARLQFERMKMVDREAILEFLRSLQVLPAGSPRRALEASGVRLPYRKE